MPQGDPTPAAGAAGVDVVFCPCCQTWPTDLKRDSGGRPRGCPVCDSLERHRLLSLLLPALNHLLNEAGDRTGDGAASSSPDGPGLLVLDVAPSRALDATLARLPGARVVRMDFDPNADGRIVDVRASVTQIPLDDAGVDLLVCSHVLEHVPDDAAAMADIRRVLGPRGVGLVVVPWRDAPTDEDPSASVEERLRRFGQADHVRYYGHDFEQRLAAAGLAVERMESRDVVEPWVSDLTRLMPQERFWLVRPDDSEVKLPDAGQLARGIGGHLLAALRTSAITLGASEAGLRAEVSQARDLEEKLNADLRWTRAQYEKYVARFDALRRRRVVRLLSVTDKARARLRRR